jgi:acetyl-CoA decarbonylase/synthase complex subunit epsilon
VAAEPWQRAETPGPLKAFIIQRPEVAVAVIKKARRPILVAGHEVATLELSGERPIYYVARIAEVGKIPVVATANTVKAFVERGFRPKASMGSMEIASRLADEAWLGLDGGGRYDTLIILGLPYYMGWLILSGLKHFAGELTTLSLDRYYQPHANWSFPNMALQAWEEALKAIVSGLERD